MCFDSFSAVISPPGHICPSCVHRSAVHVGCYFRLNHSTSAGVTADIDRIARTTPRLELEPKWLRDTSPFCLGSAPFRIDFCIPLTLCVCLCARVYVQCFAGNDFWLFRLLVGVTLGYFTVVHRMEPSGDLNQHQTDENNAQIIGKVVWIMYLTCYNNTRRVKLRNPPQGVNSSCLCGCPGGWNPHGPKSDHFKNVCTSRRSTRKQNSRNNHIYHFHASEWLNLIFG